MKISVRTQGFERSAAIDEFTRDHVKVTMNRFAYMIRSVDVFMKDVNGPKGGVDKQVLLRIKMRSGQQLALQTVKSDLYAAISISAKRAKRVVRRNIRKSRRVDKTALRTLVSA